MKDYKITIISGSVLLLQEKQYSEHCNIFIIGTKENCYVFDTGIGTSNLKKCLESLGYHRYKIILSHAHFDHFGGLTDFTPEDILITKKIKQNLMNRNCWALQYLSEDDFDSKTNYKKCLRKIKAISEFAAKITPIDTKNFIDNFEIFEAPGHTDDSIVLYDRTRNLLLTGDSLYFGKPFYKCVNSDICMLLKTLQKIMDLRPQLILPGHNRIFDGEELISCIEKWIQYLKQ